MVPEPYHPCAKAGQAPFASCIGGRAARKFPGRVWWPTLPRQRLCEAAPQTQGPTPGWHTPQPPGKKGGPGVPRSPEDSAAEVIEKGCHKPAENNDQIRLRRCGNFGRCPYHLEYAGQGHYPKDADGSCKYTARYQGGEKFTAKPPLVAAAVKLRQDNGYTGAESIDDKDKKVHDRTGNTDGRKGGR